MYYIIIYKSVYFKPSGLLIAVLSVTVLVSPQLIEDTSFKSSNITFPFTGIHLWKEKIN